MDNIYCHLFRSRKAEDYLVNSLVFVLNLWRNSNNETHIKRRCDIINHILSLAGSQIIYSVNSNLIIEQDKAYRLNDIYVRPNIIIQDYPLQNLVFIVVKHHPKSGLLQLSDYNTVLNNERNAFEHTGKKLNNSLLFLGSIELAASAKKYCKRLTWENILYALKSGASLLNAKEIRSSEGVFLNYYIEFLEDEMVSHKIPQQFPTNLKYTGYFLNLLFQCCHKTLGKKPDYYTDYQFIGCSFDGGQVLVGAYFDDPYTIHFELDEDKSSYGFILNNFAEHDGNWYKSHRELSPGFYESDYESQFKEMNNIIASLYDSVRFGHRWDTVRKY